MKMAKPFISEHLEPAIKGIIDKKKDIDFEGHEADACAVLFEKDDKVYICVAVFDTEDKITRYIPLSDTAEAIELKEIIDTFIK